MTGRGLEGQKETRGQIPGVSRRVGCRQGRAEHWAVFARKPERSLWGQHLGPGRRREEQVEKAFFLPSAEGIFKMVAMMNT